jgi:hypothetical protein
MSLPPASAPELGKAQRKSLASAGHLVERFAAACDLLQTHVKSGRVDLPQPWRDAVAAAGSCGLTGDGSFVLEFTLPESGKPKIRPQPLAADSALEAVAALKAQQPDTVVTGEPLPIPAALHAPLWLALVRLRQIHDFWERELRRSGLEQLLALMPDAWLADPTPLPPGAVVPRLEIGAWEDLDGLIGAGRRFELVSVSDGTTEPLARLKRMSVAETPPALVLSELEPEGAANRARAIYEKKGARVEMVGVV